MEQEYIWLGVAIAILIGSFFIKSSKKSSGGSQNSDTPPSTMDKFNKH